MDNSRVARSRAAVMDAAAALLFAGGPEAVTVDAIVARSGVAKTTVYRHWPTRDDLVTALFVHLVPRIEPPDPSLGFEDGLRALLHATAAMMSGDRWREIVSSLLMLKLHKPEMAHIEQQMHEEQDVVFRQLFDRGVAEGFVTADDDPQVLLALVVGPLLMAGLAGPTTPSMELADRVTDQFLAAQRSRQ